ncbi:NucA/NucB deoxyribonuclease domain-containing protein [Streptomyces sp. NPDC006356]
MEGHRRRTRNALERRSRQRHALRLLQIPGQQLLRRRSGLRPCDPAVPVRQQGGRHQKCRRPHLRRPPPPGNHGSEKAGKVIPGNIHAGLPPLHRNWANYDDDAADTARKNLNAKNAACRALNRPDDSYQCDEFPFASTKEGVGKGDGNFSVRYVPGTENEQAGRELGNWYGTDRILHGDAYMIYIHGVGGWNEGHVRRGKGEPLRDLLFLPDFTDLESGRMRGRSTWRTGLGSA